MNQNYQFHTTPKTAERLENLINAAVGKEFRPDDIQGVESLNKLFGGEAFSLGSQTEELSYSQNVAAVSAARNSLDQGMFINRLKQAEGDLKMLAGYESFSAQLSEGAVSRQQAATIELNAEANRQFKAAEVMFPTIHIGYNEEMLELPIDIAGVGPYNVASNPAEQFDDLRPLATILSDSSYSGGDDMKMVPVLTNTGTENLTTDYFVEDGLWEPWYEKYDQNDALGRTSHLTNYLVPRKINNIMALCYVPGSAKYENNDEIDTGSMAIQSLLFKITTTDGSGTYTLDTSSFAGNALRNNAHLNAKSARPIILKSESTNVKNFKDKDGKDASPLFNSLGADVGVFLQWDIRIEYNRDTRSLSMTLSPDVTIHHIVKDNKRFIVGSSNMSPDDAKLIKAQDVKISIEGVLLSMAHNNVNWSRYGQTITYANVLKQYNVRVQEPISVKYPMSDRDNNNAILAKCIKDMGLVISTRMTHDAFRKAESHFSYLIENNGLKVVPINDDSNEVLPGQHFFTTTAADEKINLKKATSTLDSKDALSNVQAVLVNKIIDIITDIRVRSGFSAIKEIDGRDEEYVIIAHASLAPYLMTTGDVRTFGQNVKFSVVETNVDSQVGYFWIFPKSTTKDGAIDAFGGIGICVSKELLYIEGDVRTPQRQFRMQIAQPAYLHHALGCIVGRVFVEDIKELMADGGVLSAINRHLESTIVESLPDTGKDDDDGEITVKPEE